MCMPMVLLLEENICRKTLVHPLSLIVNVCDKFVLHLQYASLVSLINVIYLVLTCGRALFDPYFILCIMGVCILVTSLLMCVRSSLVYDCGHLRAHCCPAHHIT